MLAPDQAQTPVTAFIPWSADRRNRSSVSIEAYTGNSAQICDLPQCVKYLGRASSNTTSAAGSDKSHLLSGSCRTSKTTNKKNEESFVQTEIIPCQHCKISH